MPHTAHQCAPLTSWSGRSDLTAEWLTVRDRRTGAGFTFERIGTGQMSECYRVELTYAADGAGPPSVVLKVAATDPVSRQTGLALGLYEREVRFYTDIAPSLDGGPIAPCYSRRASTPTPAPSTCCSATPIRPWSATKYAAQQSNRPSWRSKNWPECTLPRSATSRWRTRTG